MRQNSDSTSPIDLFLLCGFPLILGKLQSPIARVGAQVFVLGMSDMQRNAEGLTYDEFVVAYDSVLTKHDLSPSIPASEFVDAIGRAASENPEVANLMRNGAESIRSYIVEKDSGAVSDLGRAVIYAEMHEKAFESLSDLS